MTEILQPLTIEPARLGPTVAVLELSPLLDADNRLDDYVVVGVHGAGTCLIDIGRRISDLPLDSSAALVAEISRAVASGQPFIVRFADQMHHVTALAATNERVLTVWADLSPLVAMNEGDDRSGSPFHRPVASDGNGDGQSLGNGTATTVLDALELAELREEVDDLRVMLATVVDGSAVYRSVRDRTGRIVDFICALMTDTGALEPADTQIGHRLLELFPEADANGTFAAYASVVETGVPWEPPPVMFSRDGQVHEYHLRARRHRDGFVLAWRDNLQRTSAIVEASERMPVGGPRYSLTTRQVEILRLVADGASTEQIASSLFLSPYTVRNQVRRILQRLDSSSRAEAVAVALRHGLLTPPA